MRKSIVAIVLLIAVLFPLQLRAMELSYNGQKDFWVSSQLNILRDIVTNERLYLTQWDIGQSLQMNFHGEDDSGYIRGFITDYPELVEQIYLDANLGNFKLQWDRYNEGFLRPSWFSLDQKLRGLRFSYTGMRNEMSFLAAQGKNHLRQEDIMVYPETAGAGIKLGHHPVVLNSIQAWLDDRELQYGTDFYIDITEGIFYLQFPVRKIGHLRIKYLHENMDYLLFGGRYDRHFNLNSGQTPLDGGLIYLRMHNYEGNQNMAGMEWYYQAKPWWLLEVNTGLVQRNMLSIPSGLQEVDTNWRVANQFNWSKFNLAVDYQVVTNRFQDLLNLGPEGKHLHLSGLYEGDFAIIRHGQDTHWDLTGLKTEQQSDLEIIFLHPRWVPYFYFSNYEWHGIVRQQSIGELGYLFDLKNGAGSVTYVTGVEIKTSPEEQNVIKNAKPYLGMRYQRKPKQSLSGKLYGKEGGNFAKLELSGNWEEGAIAWKGQMKYQPEYYQTNNEFVWTEYPIDISFNWVQSRNYETDRGYLKLDLNLDLTALTGKGTRLWMNMLKEESQGDIGRTYEVGAEKEFWSGVSGYADVSIGDFKRAYTGGFKFAAYDLNYTWSHEYELLEIVKNRVGVAIASDENLNIAGSLEVSRTITENPTDENLEWLSEIDVEYPLTKSIHLGVNYAGDISVSSEHKLKVRTVYYF